MGGLLLLHSHYSILSDFDMLKAQQNPLLGPMDAHNIYSRGQAKKKNKPMGVACAAGDASAGAAASGAAAFCCGNSWVLVFF